MRLARATDGTPAGPNGDRGMFRELVRQAAAAAGTRYAILGRLDTSARVIESLALWADGEHRDLTYGLDGTPCANVIDDGLCVYPRDVARLFPEDTMLVELGIESYAGTPIQNADGRPRALLAVFDTAPLDGPRALPALRMFAARVRAELERVDAEQRESVARATVSRGDAILAAVADIAEQLLRTETWQDVVPVVLGRLGHAAAASRSALYRTTTSADGSVVSTMTHEWTADGVAATIDVPFWQSYIEDPHDVALFRQGVIQHSTSSEASAEKFAVLAAGGTMSAVAVPVFVDGELWGQLGLDECAYVRAWGAGEDDALRAAAGTLGAAISRAEAAARLTRRERVMEAVATVAERLARAPDWREVIHDVLGLIGSAGEVGRADLFECRVDGTRVTSTLTSEWVADGVEPSIDDVWTDWGEIPEHATALLRGETVQNWADDVGGQMRDVLEAEGTSSFISVPFFVDGVLAGYVGFDDTEGDRHWTTGEEEALRAFASVVGSTVERERSSARILAGERILAAVASVARLLLDAPSWEDVIDEILAMLGGAAQASRAYVIESRVVGDDLCSTLAHEWCAATATPLQREVWIDFVEHAAAAERLLRGDVVEVVTSELDDDGLRALVEIEGSQSYVGVPFFAGGEIAGYLGFDEVTHARRWESTEIDALRAAANLLGSAIERARGVDVLKARERALTAVARASQSLLHEPSFWDAVDPMFSEIGEATGASRVFLDLVTERADGSAVSSYVREWTRDGVCAVIDDPVWQNMPVRPELLERYRAGHGIQALTRDLEGPLRVALEAAGTKSGTVVPVVVGDHLWGILGLDDCVAERVWAAAEMDALSLAADALAAAVARSEADEAARAGEEQLWQAQRMEAVGRLAGGVAHDLNNYLTAIVGYGEFLRDDLPEAARGDAESLLAAAERVRQLVRRLLSLSRPLEEAVAEEVNPADVARGIEPILRALAGPDVTVAYDVPPSAPAIEIAGDELERVIVNLALNGRDAMTDRGVLTIAVDYDSESVRISVADTGEGMDEDVRARSFDPFFTTKGRDGVGLGLSTVYGIVNRRGGQIDVESAVDRGTRVTVSFPRVD